MHDCVSISKTSFGSNVGNGEEELLILGSGDFNYTVFQNILVQGLVRKRQRKTLRQKEKYNKFPIPSFILKKAVILDTLLFQVLEQCQISDFN